MSGGMVDRKKKERTRTPVWVIQEDSSSIRDILGDIVGLPSIIGLSVMRTF